MFRNKTWKSASVVRAFDMTYLEEYIKSENKIDGVLYFTVK